MPPVFRHFTLAHYGSFRRPLAGLGPLRAGTRFGERPRAAAIWKSLLEAYEQSPLDPAVAEALDAYVRRRKGEIARQSA